MNAAITGDKGTLMPNETPNTESRLAEADTVTFTIASGIRDEAEGRIHLTGGAN